MSAPGGVYERFQPHLSTTPLVSPPATPSRPYISIPPPSHPAPSFSLRRRPIFLSAFLITFIALYSLSPTLTDPEVSTMGHGGTATAFSPALPLEVARSLLLTREQCGKEFPLYWDAIERVKERQLEKGKVEESMLQGWNKEGARVVIKDGAMYVKSFTALWTYMRTYAVLAAIHDALITSPEPFPDVEFAFSVDDVFTPYGAQFAQVTPRPGEPAWLIPDFGFYSWPEPILTGYNGVVRNIENVESEVSWAEKEPKLFWRGAYISETRSFLKNVSVDQNWSDIGGVDWKKKAKGSIPLWDHCRKRFLAHAEGRADAYSGRLKYLLNCQSVVVSHELQWDQHFHVALDSDPKSPNQNIVMLPGREWETLPEVMDGLLADPDRALKIAENAKRTLYGRYLTVAANTCYWRGILRAYSETLNFNVTVGDSKDYESFMLMRRTTWDPA